MAKREIRKLSRTTNLLFPKRPFQRLVREIAQGYRDIRFTGESMQAIQEAAEIFVTEMFHKADMARKHSDRETLHVQDVRFSRFMTQVCFFLASCAAHCGTDTVATSFMTQVCFLCVITCMQRTLCS